jgi:hypothetical protein
MKRHMYERRLEKLLLLMFKKKKTRTSVEPYTTNILSHPRKSGWTGQPINFILL